VKAQLIVKEPVTVVKWPRRAVQRRSVPVPIYRDKSVNDSRD